MRTPWVYFDGKCSGCKYLNDSGYCEFTACIIPCTVRATIPEVKPKSNADRIRAMDSDQLIEWFCRGRPCGTCPYGGNVECSIRDWLMEECE